MNRLIVFAVLLGSALPAYSATWHVAKDGSGDFDVIQDAVDAASPGDTIRIHAGRYEETVEDFDLWGDGSFFANPHVAVTKDNLTFIGDGAGVTIIGTASMPDDPPSLYSGFCVTDVYANDITISDLAIENTTNNIYLANPSAEIMRVRIESAVEGVRVKTLESCAIDECFFVDCGTGIKGYSPTVNLSIRSSNFLDCGTAFLGSGSTGTLIEDCTATDMHSGFNIQQGSSATLRRVVLQNYVATGVGVLSGASVEIFDSSIVGGIAGISSCGEFLLCEGTRVSGQSAAVVDINSAGATIFRDCELINGGGLTVYCLYNGSGDCHVDMTNNYWGTDSEAQIAEWISDSIEDPDRCCTVDFIPFNDESTPTETKSWSSVKGLFEGGGEE